MVQIVTIILWAPQSDTVFCSRPERTYGPKFNTK